MAIGDKKPVVMEEDRAVPGGVATLGTDGKLVSEQIPDLEALGAIEYINSLPFTRKNLLDNWYFPDPIDQRGGVVRGYADTSVNAYTIDRWQMKGDLVLNDGYITWRSCAVAYASLHQLLGQSAFFIGKTVTLSCVCRTASNGFRLVIGNTLSSSAKTILVPASEDWQLVCVTTTLTSAVTQFVCKFDHAAATQETIDVLAIKLELGSTQTLARNIGTKEQPNWVLNDPPPNKTLELAKCQRYFRRIKNETEGNIFIGTALPSSAVTLTVPIHLDCPMRALPDVTPSAENVLCYSNATLIGAPTATKVSRNGVLDNSIIGVALTGTFTVGTPYNVGMVPGGYIDFNAEL